MERFRRAVEIMFNNWSALEIAVNQSGARDSTEIILRMIDMVVETIFPGEGVKEIVFGGNIDDQDLVDYLTDTVDDEFNTICEDNSPEEIVEVLKKLYECVALGADPLLIPEIKRLTATKNWIPTPTTPPNSEVKRGYVFPCFAPNASDTEIEADFDASHVDVKETEDLVVTFPHSPRSPPKEGSELASKLEKLALSPTIGGRFFRINKPPAVERTGEPAVGVHGEEARDEEEALDEQEASDNDEQEEASVVRVRSGKPGAKKKKKKYNYFRYTTLLPKIAAGYGVKPCEDAGSALEEATGGVEPEGRDGDQWEDVKARKRK